MILGPRLSAMDGVDKGYEILPVCASRKLGK